MKHILLLCLFSMLISSAFAQLSPQEIDYDQFIAETQVSSGGDSELHIIWWIPTEFWEMAFTQDEAMTPDQIDEMLFVLKPYSIFAIVDGDIGPFGGITYASKEKIGEYVHLQMDSGEHGRPLGENDISPDVTNLLAALEPMLASSMGTIGENMHFFVFSDKDRKSNRLLDPLDESSSFDLIAAADLKAHYDLPLSSLLEPKICPIDEQELDGKWKYCPFHGNELKEQK